MDVTAKLSRRVSNNRPLNLTQELLVCLLLSFAFGIFVCTALDKILDQQNHRAESVEMERAILHGQSFYNSGRQTYMAPWQNRILFPAFLELGTRLGIFSAEGWYVLLRLLFSIAMFAVFWFALRKDALADPKLAGIGLLLLAYCIVLTFNSSFGMTSDFPDAVFTTIFVIASLRRKRFLLLAVSIIAAANRESSAFAGVIWFFLYGIDENRKINIRESAYGAMVSICSYITVIALRFGFGGSKAVGPNTQYLPFRNNYYQIKQFVLHPTPLSWVGLVFCMAAPCVLWVLSNRQSLTFTHKRLLASTGAITAISCVFGNIGVPRIFIPSVVIAIFVAVSAEQSSKINFEQPTSNHVPDTHEISRGAQTG